MAAEREREGGGEETTWTDKDKQERVFLLHVCVSLESCFDGDFF